ncbi:SDR family oxidoreductase [Herpetosiphon geysericola]|uniref:Vi polysaccharide biosynthesis protein VipB/TviC n=1 Tax=Herpetosiphon geysericola TaxID=70996 RepID=A0A0P6YJF7_9CHLR|nr:SDR family oxidoreductase [Herpetosiphon geysericola]KPL90716.1 Vi polysaccharide biosynthesis protein VipB/TviC [Herpetosiphon geysericola]
MARYLVTGGAGFIGSHLVDALLQRGDSVRVFDNFSTGYEHNLAHCINEIELVRGDLRDAAAVSQAVAGCDVIFHEGALPSVPRSVSDPLTTDAVNTGGSLHILQAAREHGARRVVFAASSSVYGDTPTLPKVESMAMSPKSPYAVSKMAAESYLKVFHHVYGLETVGLRYFNVFGPRQDPTSQYSGVLARFMTLALQGEPYTMNGTGNQSRDFTYVANVVQANLLAASVPAAAGKVFNIACGVRVSLNEIVALLNKLVGKELPVIYGPARTGDVEHSLADISAAREVLGFEPSIDIETGIARTLDWYRTQGA